jgi:transposase-like protein
MARPTKYTPERVARIVEALEGGNTRRAAAMAAGIDEGTLERWVRRYAGFAGAGREAEAQAEVAHVSTIKQASDSGDWRAALAWLERRRNEDWGRRDKVEIVNSVRELARQAGATPEEEAAAVAEAERVLAEMRKGAR